MCAKLKGISSLDSGAKPDVFYDVHTNIPDIPRKSKIGTTFEAFQALDVQVICCKGWEVLEDSLDGRRWSSGGRDRKLHACRLHNAPNGLCICVSLSTSYPSWQKAMMRMSSFHIT